MLNLDARQVLALPLDELSMRVLRDIESTGQKSAHNYSLAFRNQGPFGSDDNAVFACLEAMGWLRARGLIADTDANGYSDGFFVTRAGQAALKQGLGAVRAGGRLQEGLHPLIEKRARPQFLMGEYEQAVFVGMKAVEVRVRELGRFEDGVIGVDLMNRAFGPSGPLTDATAAKGEQEGTRMLFAGAYAVLRNPAGHREVDYDDPSHAAEAVTLASLLMRILDLVEGRIAT